MNPLDTLSQSLAGGEIPPQTSGVYILALGLDVVYVGSSRNILARIGGHASKRRTRRLRFDRALWLELPIKKALRYEGALIRALNPPLNDHIPAPVGSDAPVLRLLGLPPHADEAALFEETRRRNGRHMMFRTRRSAV